MQSTLEIKKFSLGFDVTDPYFTENGLISILKTLAFSNVDHVDIKEGSYTPNNDYLYLRQNIPADKAPNFIYINSPKPFVLTITAQGNPIINAAPINKVFLLMLPPTVIHKIDYIYFEGRTTYPEPMEQNVEVKYLMVAAQATF